MFIQRSQTNRKRRKLNQPDHPKSGASSSSTPPHGEDYDGGEDSEEDYEGREDSEEDYEGGDEQGKRNDYEVFLSFRGEDTRTGFTDHLHAGLVNAGIHVFRDDNELPIGEEIGLQLPCRIKQSKISIPIISENYAFSKWCLRELVEMLKCKRSMGQRVFPIFYKVKPSQLRHLTGSFRDAINAHKENLDEMVVKEWEEALKEVSFMKGWESEKINNGHEASLITTVVKKVMGELKRLFLQNIPQQLVGVDDHVEHIMSQIGAKLSGTRIIGLYGIGGVGKTTLAKVLYSKLSSHYECRSFVADIRESSNKGIWHVQKQLLSDILGDSCDVSNVDEGINVIKSRFARKKVLIVLDDMDNKIQLNGLVEDGSWIEAESIVIITTRDKRVLDEARAEYMYPLDGLPSDQSLTLFNRHAFQRDSTPSGYEAISRDIVSTTGGLPLALEVIGSFLYGKKGKVWKDTLKKLREVPDQQVQDKLIISYNALDYFEQQIFLDIACFFIGSCKQHLTYMWDACGFFPERSIEVLSLMSLIKIDEHGKLIMHDQLRDLGRTIVRLENPKEPQERSRLWIYKEVAEVLENKKSMEDMKDEVRQQAADMETSDRNYTIAAVQNIDGIDDRVKQIVDLLEMEINDEVRIIGIYGVNGIGKTTLAKAVYNRISSCFDSCSFLTEVEETTIQPLQTKLIRDILERDREDSFFDEKIDLVQDVFRGLKVLIVVDDVKEQSHLYSIVGEKEQPRFGPGSRIIVTSENREILKDYDPEKACTYTVNALDDGQVFELFCKHAFRMQSSLPDYDGLANCIVNATDKLPLSVEVVGSFLRGKSIQEWEKMEKSMKQFMMKSRKTLVGLEEILDICYKELDQQQKDIFLDIASFISSVDARIASYMWPNYPSSGCILMPLAKIGENNELQMHSSPRRLGRRILDPEGSGDPVGRKFYIQERGPKAVSLEKGMENVEPLFVHFTAEDFRNMPDIRFLKLENAKVSGNFEGAFASLRWLCWQRFPVEFDAFNFVLGELVILDLSWSKVTECWGGWSIIKMEKLKVLNLTGCSDLLFTPDFSGYKDLEILILERCSRLVKLDPSIGRLKRLVSLNLKCCSQLNGLPVELGRMTAMKELFIDGTSVQQIPISIGNLKQLKILSGWKCFSLTHLPSSISYLPALSELSLDGAKITELPSSLGQLLQLRQLSLKDCCYLEELPDSIGEMRSLEGLDISATNISELPNSIRNLDSLKVLRMDYSFIQAFPGEIGNLTSLEELNASWCRSLKGAIPRDIKELHNLKSLILGHSGISSLPSEISTITGLHTLDLLQCNEIEVLPELPPSLISLRVSSKRMKVIPLLKGLKELEEICLSDEDLKERQPLSEQPTPESNVKHPLSMWFSRFWNLQLFQTQRIDKQSFLISFPKLRKLELSLSQIIKLKFELTDIPQLKTLTLSGLSLKEVSALPKTLSVFKLYHSAIKEIEGLEGLKALKRLDISDCKIQNLKGIDQLTSLRSLILCDCDDLSLPDLSNLVSLKVLEIRRCKMIHQIKEIEGLKALKRLDISDCKIQNLEGIDQLTSLRSLILSDCDELSLPDLSNLVKLKVLEIRRCKMIQQIKGLEKIASLEKLNISECPAENSEQVKNALKLVMARSVIT